MEVRVVAVGRVKERGLREAVDDYLERIGHYAKVKEIELADKFEKGLVRRDMPQEILKALVIPAAANLSRPQLEELEKGLRDVKGFKGLARAKAAANKLFTP